MRVCVSMIAMYPHLNIYNLSHVKLDLTLHLYREELSCTHMPSSIACNMLPPPSTLVNFFFKMIQSLALFYGYYVIGCESCGISDEVLKPIIGERCSTRSLSLIQENGVRPCRHGTAGLERCNTADSQG